MSDQQQGAQTQPTDPAYQMDDLGTGAQPETGVSAAGGAHAEDNRAAQAAREDETGDPAPPDAAPVADEGSVD